MNKDFDPKDIVMNFPRRDARDKLMGRTKFSIDSFGSDVLHAVLLRSDVPSAEIIGNPCRVLRELLPFKMHQNFMV